MRLVPYLFSVITMTLKRIDCKALQKARDEFRRLANNLEATANLAEEQSVEFQSNQLGNLKEGLKRSKRFVIDADNRVREAIFRRG